MSVEARIAALETQVAELSRLVAEQRDALAERKIWHSMARTLSCPSCGGGSIIAVRQLRLPGLVDLTLSPPASLWKGYQAGDPLVVYVCKECKLVEWRVHTLDHLVPDGKNVFEMRRPDDDSAQSSGDPYR
jgi:hypothetical protein